jgi:putative ABC transport system substrate-binding protein
MRINHLGRREFIALLGGAVAATSASCSASWSASWHLAARAQPSPSRIPVVGVLWHAASAEEEEVYLSVLLKAFQDLGYVEGKNIRLEHRFPAENPDRFRTCARELVESKVDAIIAVTTLGAVELKKLTSTIPIVFVIVADPIGFGLVESLARKALGAVEGSGSEPVACGAARGSHGSIQATHFQGEPSGGRGARNIDLAGRDRGA